jgi:hypothetical protein
MIVSGMNIRKKRDEVVVNGDTLGEIPGYTALVAWRYVSKEFKRILKNFIIYYLKNNLLARI